MLVRMGLSLAFGATLALVKVRREWKEREFSFYGDIDFIPTERYGPDDAERAREAARLAVRLAGAVVRPPARSGE